MKWVAGFGREEGVGGGGDTDFQIPNKHIAFKKWVLQSETPILKNSNSSLVCG